MALAPVMSAFLMSSLNFLVYFIMGNLALSFVIFDHLYNLSNSEYAFPGGLYPQPLIPSGTS